MRRRILPFNPVVFPQTLLMSPYLPFITEYILIPLELAEAELRLPLVKASLYAYYLLSPCIARDEFFSEGYNPGSERTYP